MITVSEGRQYLDFGPSWAVLKWDAASEYVGSMESALANLPGAVPVKAVDVVAVESAIGGGSPTLCVAEFKDYAHPSIPPAQQSDAAQYSVSDHLMADLTRKVVDSLCGITFSHDKAGLRCAELDAVRRALGDLDATILLLFCVEVPRTQAVAVGPWTTALKRRLAWLGPRALPLVTSSHAPFSGHVGVSYRI